MGHFKTLRKVFFAAFSLLALLVSQCPVEGMEASLADKILADSALTIVKKPLEVMMKDVYLIGIKRSISNLKKKRKGYKGLSRSVRQYIRALAAIWTGDIVWFITGTSNFNPLFWGPFLTDFEMSLRNAWVTLLVDPASNCVSLLWAALIPVLKKHKSRFDKEAFHALLEILSDKSTKQLGHWCSAPRLLLAKSNGNELASRLMKRVVLLNKETGGYTIAKPTKPITLKSVQDGLAEKTFFEMPKPADPDKVAS